MLLLSASGEARPPDKTARIGLLDYGAPSPSSDARWNAFRVRLRELGYVEGRNVAFEVRWASGRVDRLSGLAEELIESKVDVVVTVTTDVAVAVRRITSSVPIVTATGGDPVAAGLAASLARPGGNVTGVTSLNRNLIGKRLELVKQLLPQAARIAILQDPDNRATTLSAREAARAAKPLGIAVPMMAPAREYAEAGGLVSYGTDYPALFRQAAAYVDRILHGAKPAELPIEQPVKFELVINLKTIRALGLTIPPPVLGRADEVIQ
ncbi:MAG TPA: ABC transporter substrate-binding protein [Methylomirabilota bacterium]|nr:ABC transporter substrate-binding protein [Methylomirabilota bacterium]